ncbi:FAD synthetase 1, chloroplastic-like isoform X1 [Olea europaea var. sylvestris]|uniref:FAD synthase n=1 Tax=Olea europaea subsp. europaea TaxID=158383 RepID=A0A8S0Q7K9_OLEEU|nr:FAD synthetase 1, chloroplastic-like isoform X1 [Olea europaea var. sylvestris]CAA2963434.1 FAD synthetase 1, chloroplastic-like [Olea europaea subsp. europaea]
MLGGSRSISQHLRDYHCNPRQFGVYTDYTKPFLGLLPFSFSPSSKRFFRLRLFNINSSYSSTTNNNDEFFRVSFVNNDNCVTNTVPSSLLSDVLSPMDDDQEPPSEGLSIVAGGIVALGKFDALHIGHRELAIQAAKIGVPFLLAFVGMAEILGWEPRAPIVAKCDRKRVLSSWAPHCGNVTPREFEVEFSKVRHLTPRQFVEKLAKELRVHGVVAGQNYRFGYRAAGDARDLVQLCKEYGIGAYIINPVMDKNQDSANINSRSSKEQGQVSSTRVRHALSKGDMKYVSELLGRHHRLMVMLKNKGKVSSDRKRLSAPRSCLLNLPPKEGTYSNCSLLIDDKNVVPCRITIDTTEIHLDYDLAASTHFTSPDLELLGIDFGESMV